MSQNARPGAGSAVIADGRPTRIALWATELSRRDVPPVCAWTGLPADRWQPCRFTIPMTRGGRGALVLVDVVAGALGLTAVGSAAGGLALRRFDGALPISQSGRRREMGWGMALLAVACGVPLAIGLAMWQGASGNDGAASGLLLAAAVLLIALVAVLAARHLTSPHGRYRLDPDRGEGWVLVRGVHPSFAAAVRSLPRSRPSP